MNRRLCLVAALIIPFAAHAATYEIQRVKLPNHATPSVTAIAGDGTLGGYFANKKGVGEGFLLRGASLTILPNLLKNGSQFGTPAPTSILPDGTVAGNWYDGSQENGFVWQNGAYSVTFTGGGPGSDPVAGINSGGVVVGNAYIGHGLYNAYEGVPPNFNALLPPGSFPVAVGINTAGTISGTFQPTSEAIFLYSGGVYTTLAYPGANATYGGFLNDAGEVAGTYQDKNNHFHGFVEQNGKFTRFDAPRKKLLAFYARGLSSTSYVTGVYYNLSHQYGFVYHDGTLNEFARWPDNDAVFVVGVSDAGVVAFQKNGVSYTATCNGDGC